MSFLGELKRRNVIRVAVAYLVFAWLVMQILDVLSPVLDLPQAGLRMVLVVLAIGFVGALVFSWVFELTPEGLRRESEVDRSRSVTHITAKKLDIAVIALLVLAIGLFVFDRVSPVATKRAAAPTAAVAGGTVATAEPVSDGTPPRPAPRGSVAVLPFANRSAKADAAYFVDGVHDDLITQVARNGALKVISRTSVMEYRDTKKNLRQIGRELGVATVVEGAVQRAGNRVRINAQLIDTATDKHLWAETFDRELTPENIFEIQTDIARAIAAALAQALGEAHAAQAAPTIAAPTRDSEAYDLYLRARAIEFRTVFTAEPSERAAELYRKAIARDPSFALAMGELGYHLGKIYSHSRGARETAQRDEARHWIDRALALAPNEPRLHWILADHLYRGRLDYDGALQELAIAERGMPNGAEIFELRGLIQRRRGDLDAALRSMEAAVALDPRSDFTIAEIIRTHIWRGDLAAVHLWGERLKAIPSASVDSLAYLPWAENMLLGDIRPTREFITLNPDFVGVDAYLRWYLAYLERRYDVATAATTTNPGPVVEYKYRVYRVLPPELMHAFVLRAQGRAAEMRERAGVALAKLDAFLVDHPDNVRATTSRAHALAMLGRPEEAQRVARSAMVLASTQERESQNLVPGELITLAMTATSEEVATAMARYLALPAKERYFDSLMLDPVFDAHREHPAMRELARKYSRKNSPP